MSNDIRFSGVPVYPHVTQSVESDLCRVAAVVTDGMIASYADRSAAVIADVLRVGVDEAQMPASPDIGALAAAGIRYRAHYDLADKLYTMQVFGIPQKQKVEMLVDFAMMYYDNTDLDKMLGQDQRDHIRNEFLETIF